MPHDALLLSPDDQAVSAITSVLEEMSVTCERPLDGVSAAQKLNSHSFDLVLVDCENLPAAKLIFDVCRRGSKGHNPVPIAIVDGRAGLPTAFRLGAELILTKPVAKDQARSIIRTAVSRVRKDVPTSENASAHPEGEASAATMSAAKTEVFAHAATASSSELTNFAEPAQISSVVSLPSTAPAGVLTATLSAPAIPAKMNTAVAVEEEAINATAASPSSSIDLKAMHPFTPSDDPVLAELERTEEEESKRAESQSAALANQSSVAEQAAPDKSEAKLTAPASSFRPTQQKTRGSLVALLVLALAAGGFYAAWMYQPGFQALAKPQIDRLLSFAPMVLPAALFPKPAKPSAQSAPAAAPAPVKQTAPNTTQSTVPDSAAGSASALPAGSPAVLNTGVTATPSAATASVPTTTPGKAVVPPTSGTTTKNLAAVSQPETNKSSDSKSIDPKTEAAASTPLNAPLPGENNAIILSSKGAEKRLAYGVAPKYPVEARSDGAEGTVILKAVVGEDGKVEGLRLVEGNATLAIAAIQAVKQWHYRPYVRDGKAQSFQTVVIVDFQRP
jgi:TonB family protein